MNDSLTPEEKAYADWVAAHIEEWEKESAKLQITVDYYIAEFI